MCCVRGVRRRWKLLPPLLLLAREIAPVLGADELEWEHDA